MITKIKWKNHNVLGNLELDFTKNGKPCNTIVIAGENGTGKTTILEALYSFLYNSEGVYLDHIESIEYAIGSDRFRIYNEAKNGINFIKYKDLKTGEVFDCGYNDKRDIRSYGVTYSKAHLGLNADYIQSITSKHLDNFQRSLVDNRSDDPTTIKQLIIDITSQDNNELRELMEKNRSLSNEEFDVYNKNSRIYRFKNAFNKFFENTIQFDKVDLGNPGEKRIIFKKHDKEILIDSLSTGEKQIVFRGSYLLQDQKQMDGGIILIDEPELSMHPLWQEKILEYYRNMFTTPKDLIHKKEQKAQMIIATHSEYVIKSALKDKENVLVVELKNNNGKIESHPVVTPTVLPTITLAETNYDIFNIVSTDYHILLYGYLQKLTNNTQSVKDCDEYIRNYIINNNKDQNLYLRNSSYNSTQYKTLSTYIRNEIDHPHFDNGINFGNEDLESSIELLIEIIKDEKSKASNVV